jgi:hypothetical protein
MMSNGSQEIERVRRARCVLERIANRLLRPNFETLTACASDLNQAVVCLTQLDVSLQSPIWQGVVRRKIETEVVDLRHAIALVEELLKNAGKFYAGLARLMAPDDAPANYTAAGSPGSPCLALEKKLVLHG